MPTPLAVSLVDVDRPLRALLDLMATWKVDGVQLDTRQVRPSEFGQTARRQLRHTLDERRLKLSGLFVPTRSPLADLSKLDARLGAITEAMPLAFELGSQAVVVRLGAWPGDDDSVERLGRVLRELAAASDRLGPMLTLIPPAGAIGPLAAMLAELNAPIGVQFDPAAAVFGGDEVSDALRSLAPDLVQLRLRDGQRHGGDSGGQETVLGRGEVEWDELATLTADLPQLRWLVADRTVGGQRSVDLQNAVSYARQVFRF